MVKEYRFDILKYVLSCIESDISIEEIERYLTTWVAYVADKPIYFKEGLTVSKVGMYSIYKDWCREVK